MKFLDLFSGIGGFRLGMEMAGHECVGHVEIDKFANKSYEAMHSPKESEYFGTDIRTVDPCALPYFDVLCGGFPCQAFSIAGKRRGFEDTRGTLFFEIARIAKERKPHLLFLENVAGLLSHDNGRTFETILGTLFELGYWCEWQVCNSKHFGVPQNRERVFLVGHLRGGSSRQVFPITGDRRETDDSGIQTGTLTTRYPASQREGTYIEEIRKQEGALKQIIRGSQGQRVYDIDGVFVTLSSQGGGQGAKTGLYAVPVLTPDRIKKRQNGRRFKENGEEMFTLTAQDRHGVMIQRGRGNNKGGIKEIAPTLTKNSYEHNNHLMEDKRIRKLTPLECFRLQGFPDEYFYRAQAVNSDSQLYKQAGNSVTVNVIYEIAKRLEELN